MHDTVVLVLTWNGEDYIRPCLDALLAQQWDGRLGVLIVDNASADDTAAVVKTAYPQFALIRNARNLGFAGGNNVGLQAILSATAPAPIDRVPDTIVLLNQDTEVAPDWLHRLQEAFGRYPDVGIAGCKMLFPDGKTLQHAGGTVDWPLAVGTHRGAGETDTGQYDSDESVDFVTGAALAVRRTVLERVGLLDAGFFPAYYEDADLCYRARAAGFEILYTYQAKLMHHESASLRAQSPAHQRAYHRNRVRFILKYCSVEVLEQEWLPRECEEIRRWSLGDSLARKHAYVDALLQAPSLGRQGSSVDDAAAHYARVARVLRVLHQTVVEEERIARAAALGVPLSAPLPGVIAPHNKEGTPA